MNKPEICEPDRNTWATPPDLWAAICHRFGTPMLDVCASLHNSKCIFHYDETQDGLKQPWRRDGEINFCNPGYSNVEPEGVKAASNAKDNMIWVFYPTRIVTQKKTIWWDWTKDVQV